VRSIRESGELFTSAPHFVDWRCDLTSRADPTSYIAVGRPLRTDLGLAYLALLVGVIAGLAVGPLLAWGPAYGLLTQYGSPTIFLALFLGYKAPVKTLALARGLGALVGWIAAWQMVGVIFFAVYLLGGPVFVIAALVLTTAAFVALGMRAGSYVLSWSQHASSRAR